MNLNRIIVLTTGSSCSASELVINSLEPFIDVVLVGQKTYGKPYGSLGRTACGKQMNALEFEFVNASNAGGYYDGIYTDCSAIDDLDHALGDPQETMLNAGLNYIATSSCQFAVARQSRVPPTAHPVAQSDQPPGPQPWQHEAPGISDLGGIAVKR